MRGSSGGHTAAVGAASERTRLWTIGLSALLIALGFGRQRTHDAKTHYAPIQTSGFREPEADSGANAEAHRGRSADTPSDIPAPGWKDILLRVYQGISEDRILLVAAGVTFYSLLSIFPGIAALISIYGLFADPGTVANQLDTVANVAPAGAIQLLRDEMTRLATRGSTTLGIGFVVSLAISLWTTNSGVSAIFDALNIVYEEKGKRGLIGYYTATLTFTVAAIAFVLLSIAVVVLLPVALNFIPLPGGADLIVRIVRWPIIFVLVALALACLYRYGPSRSRPRWRWISWGSGFAAIVWLVVSVLFSWYVANFGSYNKTYGSLGAVVGFMTWIWISIIVVLVGAKLDAEMEHQTVQETTSGEPKPPRSARGKDGRYRWCSSSVAPGAGSPLSPNSPGSSRWRQLRSAD